MKVDLSITLDEKKMMSIVYIGSNIYVIDVLKAKAVVGQAYLTSASSSCLSKPVCAVRGSLTEHHSRESRM